MKYTYLVIASLVLLPACGPQYQKAQLKTFHNATAYETKQGITVSAHHMTRSEIHQTFGTRGRKLGYHGLCPIQLSINNNSEANMIFDPAQITLKYAHSC